jgi:hypothetical protein
MANGDWWNNSNTPQFMLPSDQPQFNTRGFGENFNNSGVGGGNNWFPEMSSANMYSDQLQTPGLMQGAGQSDFQPSGWQKFSGYTDPNTRIQQTGWGMPAIQGLSTVGQLGLGAYGAYLGKEQLDLAKDQYNFQKESYQDQYNNQRTLTNNQLREKQERRAAANPNAMSADEYMQKYGI